MSDQSENTQYPVDLAASAVGSQKLLAELCGVTPQAITKWRPKIPAERVLDIERVSGVSRHVLRPDLYPRETVNTANTANV